MKLPALCLLTVAAFITAATFKYNRTPLPQIEVKKAIVQQKQLYISCSPLYIPMEDESIPRLTGWGNYSWKISTPSDSAQFYFDQGINMYYAFHIIEARASFDKATRFDPACAMAWWGKALAFGPNINDFGYQRPSEAYPSAMKANELKTAASPTEQELITAMAIRYSADSSADQALLNKGYTAAMKEVFSKHNNNADVSALYADALMLLHPWDLYNKDYTAKKWTPEIVGIINHTFTLNKNHPGANHYFIHAVEASAKPADALRSANFLAEAMPEVSHITHMPSHIYIRTGYYNKGIEVNDKAVAGYKKYLGYFGATAENIALYSLHNEHMKVNCAQMAGNYEQSIEAATGLQKEIPSFYLTIGGAIGNYVQYLHQSPLFTQLRFGKWKEILNEPVNDSLSYTPVLQHFARGMAYARTNRLPAALKELELMKGKMNNPSLKEPLSPFNSAYNASLVAFNILEGVIAEQQKDHSNAIAYFKKAVSAENELIYNEPRDWLLPARQYLGNALLKAGKNEEAVAVLNEDLAVNPQNGWALQGITTAYKKMNKANSMAAAQRRLQNAWLIKDVEIKGPVF